MGEVGEFGEACGEVGVAAVEPDGLFGLLAAVTFDLFQRRQDELIAVELRDSRPPEAVKIREPVESCEGLRGSESCAFLAG